MHESAAALDSDMLAQIDALEAFQPGAKRQLVDLFVASVSAHRDSAVRALAAGDAEALRVAAHSVKGVAASLGARQLSELAAQLETAARAGMLDGAAPQLERIGAAFDLAARQLQAWVGAPVS